MDCTAQQSYKRVLKLMGSRFEITVVANDSIQANKHIDKQVNKQQEKKFMSDKFPPKK